MIARQPLAEPLEHRRPIDQQIEDHDRRDQQNGNEVDQGRTLIPGALCQRACDTCPVRGEFRDCLLDDGLDLFETITEAVRTVK